MSSEELEQKILPYIDRNPGCTIDRISVYLGLGVKAPQAVKKTLQHLEITQQIERKKDAFADQLSPFKYYRFGWQPKQAPPKGRVSNCETRIDLSVIDSTPQQVRSPIEDVPLSFAQSKELSVQYQEKLKKLRELCKDMVTSGTPRTASDLSREVCKLSNWVHSTPEAKRIYNEAIAQIQQSSPQEIQEEAQTENQPENQPEESPVSVVVTLEEEIHRLRAELAKRDRQISEKDETITRLTHQLQSAVPPLHAYDWIVQQCEHWEQTVESLSSDLAIAQQNLEVFNRLADQYRPSTSSLNGHREAVEVACK